MFDFSFGIRGSTLDYEAGYYAVSDLVRSVDDIFKSFTKGNKSAIKKCARSGVTVREFGPNDIDDSIWSEFQSLHRSTGVRNNFFPYSNTKLAFLYAQLKRGRFLLLNSYDGNSEICASILVNVYKDAALYYGAACTREGLALGAMVHLHFEAMKAVKERGYRFYCLGARIPSAGETKDARIGAFKSRLGNERWDILSGERILKRREYIYRVLLPKIFISPYLVPGLRPFATTMKQAFLRLKYGS
jgi:hypothetical protein